MARLYTNENFPQPAVERLRELGHDVTTTLQDGRANTGIPDRQVLSRASELSRVVVKHRLVSLEINQPAGTRQGGVVRGCLVQREIQKAADTQRIGGPPRDPALRVQAFKVPQQQQPKIPPGGQTRPPDRGGIEFRAQPFNKVSKPASSSRRFRRV